jgi:hypothetical protein
MKNVKLFVVFFIFFRSVSLFSFVTVPEIDYKNYNDINIDLYELNLYDRQYTEKEWWKGQPVIRLNFTGDEKYLPVVKSVLKECGCVLGDGEDFNLYLQTIEDKFLYLNLDYKDVRFDNMKSLITTDSDVEKKIFGLFSEKIGNFKRPLPKLILIKCDELLNTDAEFIYRGPAYYLFRTFEDVIKIEYEGEIEQVDLPFKPVVFFDFSEKKYSLTIKSGEKVEIYLDGIQHTAPVVLSLDSGVHELSVAGEKQYIYMIEDTEIIIDEKKLTAKIIITTDDRTQIKILKNNDTVEIIYGDSLEFDTIAGTYEIILTRDGFSDFHETFEIKPGEILKKEIKLKGEPGTIAFKIDLSGAYEDLFVNDKYFIASGETDSLMVSRADHKIKYLEERTVSVTENYIVTDRTVYDGLLNAQFFSDIPIVGAVETNRGLWLFLSDRMIKNIDTKNWDISWMRNIDYLPVDIKVYGNYVSIFDAFSHVILIETDFGYNEIINERVLNACGVESVTLKKELVTVFVKGAGKKISYFFKMMKRDISSYEDDFQTEGVVYKEGFFYQDGEQIFVSSNKPVDYSYDDEICVFVTNDSMKVFYLK